MKSILLILLLFTCCRVYAQQKRNEALIQQLDSIRVLDQVYRGQLDSIQAKFAPDTIELRRQLSVVFNKMKIADSTNMVAVQRILLKYGWPAPDVIGTEGSATIFLVIQHADLSQQKEYLPVVRAAVKQQKLKPSSLALLEDRIALKDGRKQIYGTQVSWDLKTNTYTMTRLEDPDNVDKRRAAIGLPSLDVYLQSCCNTKWDVAAYKKAEQKKQ